MLPEATPRPCWICGADANTREHRIKATDLRGIFRSVSQKDPILYKAADDNRVPIGSTRSDRLKFEEKICGDCNNRRTQPFDRAWEKLSAYLRSDLKLLARSRRIDLSRIFPGATKLAAVHVHLYFAKLFGCLIAEHKAPIDITGFSRAIMGVSPHPNLYLSFILRPEAAKIKTASITPINALEKDGVPVFASWYYRLGGVVIDVVYSVEQQFMRVVTNPFHPSTSTKMVRLGTFKTNPSRINPAVAHRGA